MTTTNGNQSIRVAFLLEDKFEDSEFQILYTALQKAGAEAIILGSRMNDEDQDKKGQIEDFDAVVIPGGAAPDKIRANPHAVHLVINAMAQTKIVAAVCH